MLTSQAKSVRYMQSLQTWALRSEVLGTSGSAKLAVGPGSINLSRVSCVYLLRNFQGNYLIARELSVFY